MSDATLTVPAKYADDFRAALVHELVEEAAFAKKARKELLEAVHYEKDESVKCKDADWRTTLEMLDRDAAMFRQAVEGTGEIEISVSDDKGTVAFACETVARKIIGPQLMEALDCGPFDEDYAAKLHDLIERLMWAVGAAVEVNASYFPEADREGAA